MIRKPLLIVIAVLALVTMACGVQFNLPVTQIKTGPVEKTEISVPPLEDTSRAADVTLSFGAGDLKLSPGAENAMIIGTATYNVADFKPEVKVSGNTVDISQGDLMIQGLPSFDESVKNLWDLKLGESPIKLRVNAGAYNGTYDLGGLSLQDLEISDGASNVDLKFSEPNKVEMDTFRYSTGASDVHLSGLANANLDELIFHSGAGAYSLDFSGKLQRDANITVESGISTVIIIVPEGVSAEVTFEGGMSSVNMEGGWKQSGNTYRQSGSGPVIRITVKMGAGSLELKNK